MKKSFNVDSTFNNMRIDRWIRNNLGNIPQSLIEKSLRNGKIKVNNKKTKSSQKLKLMTKLIYLTLIIRKQLFKKKLNLNHQKK